MTEKRRKHNANVIFVVRRRLHPFVRPNWVLSMPGNARICIRRCQLARRRRRARLGHAEQVQAGAPR